MRTFSISDGLTAKQDQWKLINKSKKKSKQSPFQAIAFLRRFCQTCLRELHHPVFTSLDFTTIISFCRARSSALCATLNLVDQVSVFTSPSDRMAQLYPHALGSLFVAFYDLQGYGGGILTYLHMVNQCMKVMNDKSG
jgi:hypothetical protein